DPSVATHQASLHQAPPEQFLTGPDDETEGGGDRGTWSRRSQLVDPGNLATAAGHDRAPHPAADLEDKVQAGCRPEPLGEIAEPQPFASHGRFGGERVGTQAADPQRHSEPELRARPAEGRRPDSRGQADAGDDPLQRTADPATNPTRSNAPKAPCRRAVMRSIIAIARRWPSAPRSASRKIQATRGRLNSVRSASVGNAPTITARPTAT